MQGQRKTERRRVDGRAWIACVAMLTNCTCACRSPKSLCLRCRKFLGNFIVVDDEDEKVAVFVAMHQINIVSTMIKAFPRPLRGESTSWCQRRREQRHDLRRPAATLRRRAALRRPTPPCQAVTL